MREIAPNENKLHMEQMRKVSGRVLDGLRQPSLLCAQFFFRCCCCFCSYFRHLGFVTPDAICKCKKKCAKKKYMAQRPLEILLDCKEWNLFIIKDLSKMNIFHSADRDHSFGDNKKLCIYTNCGSSTGGQSIFLTLNRLNVAIELNAI